MLSLHSAWATGAPAIAAVTQTASAASVIFLGLAGMYSSSRGVICVHAASFAASLHKRCDRSLGRRRAWSLVTYVDSLLVGQSRRPLAGRPGPKRRSCASLLRVSVEVNVGSLGAFGSVTGVSQVMPNDSERQRMCAVG